MHQPAPRTATSTSKESASSTASPFRTAQTRPSCCCCTASRRPRTSTAACSTGSPPATGSSPPDHPGSGHTEAPAGYTYTFDRLADLTEGFVRALGLTRFALYVFDFGAPVGFRVAERNPEWIAGLIVQNGNAYADGLSDAAIELLSQRPDMPGAEQRVRAELTLDAVRAQYVTGVPDQALVAPDGWTLDHHFLERPGRRDAQAALLFDYHTNVESYDRWQAWLRKHTPPALIVWGEHDPFFTEAGARAYLRDLPDAELHLFGTGHFALETHVAEIAPLVAAFLDRTQ
ncbi:alpha/beta hydrolase [Nonomuraea salmonea]|uniref:alpha/beta fold hydrolase n=1 Tax=Nonomuraea salmonea TaxID=46181 RepID=UPI0031E76D4A